MNGTDLLAFNAYVQSQVDGLAARCEMTQGLVMNLFKGYKAVNDQAFQEYIRTIEKGHEDGSVMVDTLTRML